MAYKKQIYLSFANMSEAELEPKYLKTIHH